MRIGQMIIGGGLFVAALLTLFGVVAAQDSVTTIYFPAIFGAMDDATTVTPTATLLPATPPAAVPPATTPTATAITEPTASVTAGVPPDVESTATASPAATAPVVTDTPTGTLPPSATPLPSSTAIPPVTATALPTVTPTPTLTALPTAPAPATLPPGLIPAPIIPPSATATPRPDDPSTATPLPTATPRPGVTPSPTPRPTATPLPTATPRPGVTPSPTPRPTATPLPTATPRPGVTPSPTPRPTATPRHTATPLPPATLPPAPTATPRPGVPPSPTPRPTATPRPTRVATVTPAPTVEPAPSPSGNCVQYGQGIARSSYFGVQMYTDTRPESPYFDSLVASRAGWVRAIAPWGPTEPTNREPEQYNWRWVDKELAAASHVNLRMIGTIGFAPDWAASATNGPINKTDLSEFTDFVGALVERYDGDGVDDAPCSPVVRHWEFYNEPDEIYKWGNEPALYAEMLKAAYPVVKAASPQAQVVFGGVAQDWFVDQNGVFVRNWVQSVMAAGAGPYFDIMNIHNYPNYYRDHGAQHFPGTFEKVREFQQILRDYGFSKPMIITETGDHAAALSPDLNHRQAIVMAQVLTQARAAGVQALTWFTLYDLESYHEYTGLVTSSNPPVRKPGFIAFGNFTDLFESARFTRIWTPAGDGGSGYIGYEFDDPAKNRRFVVAWTFWDAPGNPTTQLTFNAARATKIDLYGATTTLTDGADGATDGKITVTVGKEPVIVQLAR